MTDLLELSPRKYNMSLEHLVVPESKQVLKEFWTFVKNDTSQLASNEKLIE